MHSGRWWLRTTQRVAGVLLVVLLVVPVASWSGQAPLTRVRLGLPNTSMLWGPLYLAQDLAYFTREGLEVEFVMITTGGGPAALAGVISGRTEFAGGASIEGLQAVLRKQPVKVAALLVGQYAIDIALRKDVAAQRGVRENSSLRARIESLKGLRVSVTSVGGGVHQFARYALLSIGLNPDTDVTFVAIPGTAPPVAALERRQVDPIVAAPPTPQLAVARGLAIMLLSGTRGDMQSLRGYAHSSIFTSDSVIQERPEVVLAFDRAIARAQRLIKASPLEAKQALRTRFAELDEKTFETVFDQLQPA